MRYLRHRAFTLPELLIVIAIIGVLATLIGMTVGNVYRISETTQCVARLHHLYEAYSMRRNDSMESKMLDMDVRYWPAELLPYIDFQTEVLQCPAQGGTESTVNREGWGEEFANDFDPARLEGFSSPSGDMAITDKARQTADISELIAVRTAWGSNEHFIPAGPGAYCVKLSDSQYDDARAQGLLGNADSSNFFRSKWTEEYRDDGSGNYWLCFEDYGGDDDFKDVMIHVTDNGDGTYALSVYSGNTGHTNSIVSVPDHEHLMSVPANTNNQQVTVGQSVGKVLQTQGGVVNTFNPYRATTTEDLEGTYDTETMPVTSYAINAIAAYAEDDARLVPSEPGKVLLLDYLIGIMVKPTDCWSDADPNQDGVPVFARHNQHLNVLFTDGSVRTMEPKEVDPAYVSNQKEYWDP